MVLWEMYKMKFGQKVSDGSHMHRRYFLKTISILSFSASAVYMVISYVDQFLRKTRSPYEDNGVVKDRMAFCHAVYPLFSDDKLLKDTETILNKKKEWKTIETTFFSHYYDQGQLDEIRISYSIISKKDGVSPKKNGVNPESKKPFFTLSPFEREQAIISYIDGAGKDRPADREAFDAARNTIVGHLIRHSYSPFSAYGYPDRRILPFMADPSWDTYHLKPGRWEKN